jgi:hypothetical protein
MASVDGRFFLGETVGVPSQGGPSFDESSWRPMHIRGGRSRSDREDDTNDLQCRRQVERTSSWCLHSSAIATDLDPRLFAQCKVHGRCISAVHQPNPGKTLEQSDKSMATFPSHQIGWNFCCIDQ